MIVLDNAAARGSVSNSPAEAAEPLYRRAIALDPGSVRWRERLARTLLRLTRPVEAITELEAALERAHEDWIALGLSASVTCSKQ